MKHLPFKMILSLFLLCLMVPNLNGALLTGLGPHLGVPSSGMPNTQVRSVTGNTTSGPWQGSWSAPALTNWVGTFDVTGPTPTGTSSNTGTSVYDFTSLPTGALPAGTFFRIGDLDQGSAGTEILSLTATDANGAILNPWLDEPIGVGGTGSGSGNSILLVDMPGWSYGSGSYKFDGSTVPGNPNVAFMLTSNVPITTLTLVRQTSWANFSLHAPIPEPASAITLLIGTLAMVQRRPR